MSKRVLYVLEDYPVSSETYVETEIDYFLEQGIEISVWVRRCDPNRPSWRVPVYSGCPVQAAVESFKPNVIHVHWLPLVPGTTNLGVPVTVRSHSFEFSKSSARGCVGDPGVKALFIFPHLAEEAFGRTLNGNVIPLPVAYSERLFYPVEKVKGTVIRASAGLSSKDLDSFIETAYLCPKAQFTLVTSVPKEDQSHVINLHGKNQALGNPVRILTEMPRDEVAQLVRRSEICLRSNNPNGHPFGMPISIAEAMGAGTIPVVRNHAPARGYVGDAGLYFNTVSEAVSKILEILTDPGLKERLRVASIERAKLYASRTVLPTVLEAWTRICNW